MGGNCLLHPVWPAPPGLHQQAAACSAHPFQKIKKYKSRVVGSFQVYVVHGWPQPLQHLRSPKVHNFTMISPTWIYAEVHRNQRCRTQQWQLFAGSITTLLFIKVMHHRGAACLPAKCKDQIKYYHKPSLLHWVCHLQCVDANRHWIHLAFWHNSLTVKTEVNQQPFRVAPDGARCCHLYQIRVCQHKGNHNKSKYLVWLLLGFGISSSYFQVLSQPWHLSWTAFGFTPWKLWALSLKLTLILQRVRRNREGNSKEDREASSLPSDSCLATLAVIWSHYSFKLEPEGMPAQMLCSGMMKLQSPSHYKWSGPGINSCLTVIDKVIKCFDNSVKKQLVDVTKIDVHLCISHL